MSRKKFEVIIIKVANGYFLRRSKNTGGHAEFDSVTEAIATSDADVLSQLEDWLKEAE